MERFSEEAYLEDVRHDFSWNVRLTFQWKTFHGKIDEVERNWQGILRRSVVPNQTAGFCLSQCVSAVTGGRRAIDANALPKPTLSTRLPYTVGADCCCALSSLFTAGSAPKFKRVELNNPRVQLSQRLTHVECC